MLSERLLERISAISFSDRSDNTRGVDYGMVTIEFDQMVNSNGRMSDDLIATVALSPLVLRMQDERMDFDVTDIVTYNVGRLFAGGSAPRASLQARFRFRRLSDENKAMLVLRDRFVFTDVPSNGPSWISVAERYHSMWQELHGNNSKHS